MKKFNILFCDDNPRIIRGYKNNISGNEILKEKIEESFYSYSFNVNIEDVKSVKTIVQECKAQNKTIDIAIVDINFEEISGKEIIEDSKYTFEDLGICIANYLKENFPHIYIIYLSAKPTYIENVKSQLNSKLVRKESPNELYPKLVRIILGIFEDKDFQEYLIEKNNYLYEIDFIKQENGKYYLLKIKNTRIYNKKTSSNNIDINISLTETIFFKLANLVLLSCYDDKNNIVYDFPKGMKSYIIEDKFKLDKYKKYNLYKENESFLMTIFKKVSSKDNPSCGFDIDTAKKYRFGMKHDNRTKNKDNFCVSCIDSFLKYDICPILLSYSQSVPRNVIASKDISLIKTSIDTLIHKYLSVDLKDYIWNDNSNVSDSCDCDSDDINSIKNCKFVLCKHALIFSNQVITKGDETEYFFRAKPTDNFIKAAKNYIELIRRDEIYG